MIKKPTAKRFRFIPFRKHDLLEMCLQDGKLSDNSDDFRQFYYMLSSVFHFEFHQVIESLKDAYAPLDPNASTRPYENAKPLADVSFIKLLGGLLEKANYEQVSEDDLNQAMNESSVFKIRLHVDLDDFSEALLFCRGVSTRKELVSSWFGLLKKPIEFTNYDRVVIYIRFSDDYEQLKHSSPYSKPGATILKLFQNVPKADLEMLFPNTRVRMRLVDKFLIGVPAVISGGVVLSTKVGASFILLGSLFGFWMGVNAEPAELNKASIMILFAGAAALGGYLWKQFNSFKNRKLKFTQALTQNLYFKNLDNNAGVFHRLADDAEEEENKEAMLAYYFLLISESPLTQTQLDKQIEQWLLSNWNCDIDFEIDDALNKLLSLGLVNDKAGELSAVSIESAIRILDERWDNYFVPKVPDE